MAMRNESAEQPLQQLGSGILAETGVTGLRVFLGMIWIPVKHMGVETVALQCVGQPRAARQNARGGR